MSWWPEIVTHQVDVTQGCIRALSASRFILAAMTD
jgi:hypothetical protein